ncbi:site-specific recombinase XerD [Actinoplanes lutulentus]|uniref:Phage integrase family protein n=1 Tax=Actinoplanes lutulentus TaxID=1287878 RepID=A0A327Z1R4_9ACTN|nr:tyrosine-type recombinase/integrase [Actinoplanes lutulentus]MBB2943297.1 site-specific recombinase XerD [Actinoplanes lutulentus]RAK28356.1 phage integrase family protein [Actinoplanes lutulentus]
MPTNVRGKGSTSRTVFLGADGRTALADYPEHERPADTEPAALFLSAASIGSRRRDGRLSPRSINLICEQIRPLARRRAHRPGPAHQPAATHDLRHSFAFALAAATGSDAYKLEPQLGRQSQRYIHRYPNPPEDIAARLRRTDVITAVCGW